MWDHCLPVAITSRFIALISKDFRFDPSKGITPCAVCLFVDGTNRSGARDIVFSLSDSVFFCCRCRCCSTRNFDFLQQPEGKNEISPSFIARPGNLKSWNQISFEYRQKEILSWLPILLPASVLFRLFGKGKKGRRDLKYIATKDRVSSSFKFIPCYFYFQIFRDSSFDVVSRFHEGRGKEEKN